MTTNTLHRNRRLFAPAALAMTMALPALAIAQDNSTKFGAYDPEGVFADLTTLQIEHIYVPLFDVDLASIEDADEYAKARNRELLITIEPFSWLPDQSIEASVLRDNMMSGGYDADIQAACEAIGALDSTVTIRFAHEMDESARFPWSGWDPDEYIAFYRHFHDVCAPLAPNSDWAWSPLGTEAMLSYYPGEEYADRVGVTLLSLQQYEQDKFGRARPVQERLAANYAALEGLGKPIGIFEVGFRGDEAFVKEMANEVKRLPQQFKLSEIVYFNAVDPVTWPEPYGQPDWRVGPELFETLTPEE